MPENRCGWCGHVYGHVPSRPAFPYYGGKARMAATIAAMIKPAAPGLPRRGDDRG